MNRAKKNVNMQNEKFSCKQKKWIKFFGVEYNFFCFIPFFVQCLISKNKNFSYCKWNKMVGAWELTLISAAIYPFLQKSLNFFCAFYIYILLYMFTHHAIWFARRAATAHTHTHTLLFTYSILPEPPTLC